MITLSARLEERLKKLIPRAKDRELFVRDVITKAIGNIENNQMDDEPMPESIGGSLHLYTDGGSRGNPGQAAVGCVLMDPIKNVVLGEYKEAIGIATNNVAEYKALIAGLELAQKFHPNRLVCHLDSELIVKQLSGEYRVKMQTLQPLVEEIHTMTEKFHDVGFVHVPRAQNAHADRLVNEALDAMQ